LLKKKEERKRKEKEMEKKDKGHVSKFYVYKKNVEQGKREHRT